MSVRGFRLISFVAMLTLWGTGVPALASNGNCSSLLPSGTKYSFSGTTPSNNLAGGQGVTTTSASTITISNTVTGTIQSICVDLNGVTTYNSGNYADMEYASVLLTGPTKELLLLGSSGDGSDPISNAGIAVMDGQAAAPDGNTGGSWSGSSFDVEPSAYLENPSYPPGLGETAVWPQTDGSATLASFESQPIAGTWTLTINDNDPFVGNGTSTGGDPLTITSWDIVIVANTLASSTTTLSTNANPATTSGSVTLTATVSPAPTSGTVEFQSNGSDISGCGAKAITSSQVTCLTSFSPQAVYALTATYHPGNEAESESSTLYQFVEDATSGSGTGPFCNNGNINLSNGEEQPGSPYPSMINVSGLSHSVQTLTVELEGLQSSNNVINASSFLLVAPDSTHNLEFLSGAGSGGSNTQPSVNVTFADDNGQAPADSPLTSTTYGPTDILNGSEPAWAQPEGCSGCSVTQVPGTIVHAPPDGSATNTLTNSFDGVTGNGEWALFATGNGGTESVSGGWCISFTLNTGSPTTTTVTSSANPATTGASVTITATVKSGGNPVTEGSVTFTENGVAPAGVSPNTVSVNGSGQASITTSSLSEGDHEILATYNGVTDVYNLSTATIWQRVDDATTSGNVNVNPVQFCNLGKVAISQLGPATPNPSNIFVPNNVPGTLDTVTVQLTNFEMPFGINYLASLLVGPGGDNLSFFSGTGSTGNTTVVAEGNYIFADNGGEQVPQGSFGPETYKPTSYNNGVTVDTFTASPSGFETLPGTINEAASFGSATFASAFPSGANPSGTTWSLYFNYNTNTDQTSGAEGGWCLTLNENQPNIALGTTNISPTEFTQGGTGSFTYTATNNGPGPTGGTLTLTDTLPTGLTYSGSSGTGWSCSFSSPTVTCGNSTVVPPTAGSNTYPPLTINVNVAGTAPASVTNLSTLSGSMDACDPTSGCVANDQVTVQPAPVLSVIKSHSGNFTQGSTAQWDISVANQSGSGPTSGTITVTDVLPSGMNNSHQYTYSLNGYSGTGWTCNSAGTTTITVTCQSSTSISGGSSSLITLTVGVPSTSPVSVQNTASAYGGGDPTHTSGSPATSNTDTATVTQVPASVTINNSGSPQFALVSTAFAIPLSVTVTDAASVAIQGVAVVFQAPSLTGASGTFSNNGISITPAATNASGVTSAGTFTADGTAGSYTVTATASPAPAANFSLTNYVLPTFSKAFGTSPIIVGGNTTLTFTISNPAGNPTLHNLSFSDPFPSGIAVASSPNASSSCGGTWSPSGGATSVSFSGGTLAGGGTCTISLSVTGTSATTGAVTNLTGDLSSTETGTTSLTASAQITVNPAQYQLSLIVSPAGEGTASPNPTNSTGLAAGNYLPGASVQLTANPATGYVFSSWSGSADLSSTTANPTMLTMNTNETITAKFTGGPTSLQMTASGKSGTERGSRTWSYTVTDAGSGAAVAAQMSSFSLKQVGGAACTPVVSTTFPLSLGTLAPGATAPASVTINFTGCASSARFNMTAVLSANSGATSVTVSQSNQFQ